MTPVGLALKARRRLETARSGGADVRLALGGLASKFVYAPLTFAATALLTRFLDVDEFGAYSYLVSAVLLAALPAKVGLPNVLVRFLTEYRVAGDEAGAVGLLQWGRRWMVGLGLAGSLVVAVWFALDDALIWGLVPALIVVPFLADSAARSGALRGLGRPLLGLAPDQVVRPLVHVLLVGGALLAATVLAWDVGVGEAAWLYATSFLVAWAAGAYWLRRATRPLVAQPRIDRSAWVAAALPTTLMNGMNLVNQHSDIVVLRQFASAADVGLYKVALSSVVLVSFGLQALNAVLAPRYGEAYGAGDVEGLTRLARLALVGGLAVAAPIAAVCVLAPGPLLATLFGEAYRSAGAILAVLAFGQLANALGGPCGMLMNMSGNEAAAARVVVVTSAANVVANIVVAPHFGALGCAVATSVSFVIWNVWMYTMVRHRLGVRYLS
jgi:O-antigen/teichoic acid export membrane protein